MDRRKVDWSRGQVSQTDYWWGSTRKPTNTCQPHTHANSTHKHHIKLLLVEVSSSSALLLANARGAAPSAPNLAKSRDTSSHRNLSSAIPVAHMVLKGRFLSGQKGVPLRNNLPSNACSRSLLCHKTHVLRCAVAAKQISLQRQEEKVAIVDTKGNM